MSQWVSESVSRWVVFGIYALLLLGLSVTPSGLYESVPSFLPFQDKFFHLCMYGGFAILLGRALQGHVCGCPILRSLSIVCVATVYGALMEVLQAVIVSAQRTFSWGDMLANLTGAAPGMVLFVLVYRKIAKCSIS